MFQFRGKYHISGKFNGISGKFFRYLGKMWYVRKIFLTPKWYTDRNFFGDRGGGSRQNFFEVTFFLEKCPSKPGPPNFSKLPTTLGHGDFTLKQLRLPILRESHTNSYAGPGLSGFMSNIEPDTRTTYLPTLFQLIFYRFCLSPHLASNSWSLLLF